MRKGRGPTPAIARGLHPELGAIARRVFDGLRTDFGLEIQPDTRPPDLREASVALRNATTEVRLHFDAGSPRPHVALMRLEPGASGPRVCPLRYLVRLRAPEREDWLSGAREPSEDAASAPTLEETLREVAMLLRSCAGDVLAGDFDVLATVGPQLLADRRADNRRRFGTSTGESPRFTGRPSLAELFADATVPGLRAPRAYQAVWDYGYEAREIASFLGASEAEVRALLDEWERGG